MNLDMAACHANKSTFLKIKKKSQTFMSVFTYKRVLFSTQIALDSLIFIASLSV